MCSSFKEFVTRDDSVLDESSDWSEDYYGSIQETHQYIPLLSDSEDIGNSINNGIVRYRRKNKRPRILSTSTDEEDSNLENLVSDEMLPMLLWSKKNFKPIIHEFNDQNSGVKGNLTPESTPLDAFQLFLSEELVSYIAEETNNYFKFMFENTTPKAHSRVNSWKDTSICEMYGFLAIMMLMPRVKKLTLNECWSTDQFIKINIFRKIMGRDRYMILLQMLHFNNNSASCDDPLIKIRPIIGALKNSFRLSFYPYKDLCIDESLMLYKGRCYFKQFIPSKRSRFGIKSFVLCDCTTMY